MTHRKGHPKPQIINAVIAMNADSWGTETQKVARTDAQRVLEAMIAEYGVAKAVLALDKQGFKGPAYRYLLKPLYIEARRRRPESKT